MRCTEARRLASDYIDGELDALTAHELETHLETCVSCPPLVAALTATLAQLRALPEITAISEVVEATLARLGHTPPHQGDPT